MKSRVFLAALLSFALFTACSDGLFKTLMEGKNGSASAGNLKITPSTATITVNNNLSLQATGGDGNYTFGLVGGGPGTFNSATKVYTAPASAGTATLQVTDGTGASAQAVFYIENTAGPYYLIASSPSFPASGTGGSAFTGSFKIENISAQAGADALNWKVYVSRNSELDTTLDPVAASGTLAALGASSVSSLISYSGTWPAAASSYYIIIIVTAADDVNTANNQAISPAIAVTGSTSPAYSLTSVSPLATTLVQSASSITSQTLIIKNIGIGSGVYPITWAVYLLSKTTIGAQDTAIVSGTTPALSSAATVSVPFPGTGNYPSAPGTYYFVAKVSAFDDTVGTGTKVFASSPIIVSGPEYSVGTIDTPTSGTTGGTASGTFTIVNSGSAGVSTVSWSVFASTSPTLGAGNIIIASGTNQALGAGATSAPIPYNGSWPITTGSYYIIVQVQSADDATVGMRATTGTVAVADPAYTVPPNITVTGSNVAGGAVSGSFTIQNTAGGIGSSSVSWSVYASTSSAFGNNDTLIKSGTTAALALNATSAPISYSGLWPSTAGKYYIIVQVYAVDGVTIGTGVSGQVTIAGPTYSVSGTNVSGTAPVNSSASVSFTITNQIGSGTGSSPISCSVFASLSPIFGVGENFIATNSIILNSTSTLAAGASSSATCNGTWPAAAGPYYIWVVIQAADATSPTLHTSFGSVTLN